LEDLKTISSFGMKSKEETGKLIRNRVQPT
jgi:hypothetical protein